MTTKQPPSEKSIVKLKQWYDAAIIDMQAHRMPLCAELVKMGLPRLGMVGTTAWVGMLPEFDDKGKPIKDSKKTFEFGFNEAFFNKLSFEEFKFVLAHETLHIVHGHLSRQIHGVRPEYLGTRKFAIAVDCIVNDSLTNVYNYPKYRSIAATTPIYGQAVIGMDCHDLLVHEVLAAVPEQYTYISMDDHTRNMTPEEKEQFEKDVQEAIDKSAEEAAARGEDKDGSDLERYKYTKKRIGDRQRAKDKIPTQAIFAAQTAWDRVLSSFFSFTRRPKLSWARRPNAMLNQPANIILPSYKMEPKHRVLIAVDVSGSIDMPLLNRFISMVASTPDNIILTIIAFDVEARQVSFNELRTLAPDGGTSVDCVEKYARGMYRYPDAVIVFSDGQCAPITPLHKNKWGWIVQTEKHDIDAPGIGPDQKAWAIKTLVRHAG